MLMSNCEGFGYLIPGESNCPNCSRSNRAVGQDDGGALDVVEEFSRRRATPDRNSAYLLCLNVFAGVLGLAGAGGLVVARIWASMAKRKARMARRVPVSLPRASLHPPTSSVLNAIRRRVSILQVPTALQKESLMHC